MELYHFKSRLKAAPTGQNKQSIQGCKVSLFDQTGCPLASGSGSYEF
jgi:hypothetical protein